MLPADTEKDGNLLKENQNSNPPADIPLQKHTSASLVPKFNKTKSDTLTPKNSAKVFTVSLQSLIKSPKLERKLNTVTDTSDIKDDTQVQKPPESNMVVKPATKGAINFHGNRIPSQNKFYDTGNRENSDNDYEEDRQSANENENTQYDKDTFEKHKELNIKENPQTEDRIHNEQNIQRLSKEPLEEEKVEDRENAKNTEKVDNDYEEDSESANENGNTQNDKDTAERPKEPNSKGNLETEDRIHSVLSNEASEEKKVEGGIERERDLENNLNVPLVSSKATTLFPSVTKRTSTLRTTSALTVKTTKSSVKVQTAQATNGSSHYSNTKITVTTTSTPTETAKHQSATTQSTKTLTTSTTGKQKNALHFSKSESVIRDDVENKKAGDKTNKSSDCPFFRCAC